MAALEMIHSGSLVHDDLPCMDNDEYRRGNLTTWKKYGYDMAVLAGDKLFIYAFETAAKAFALTDRADLVGKAISILANKAGIYGMIGGQSVDVEYTDRPVTKSQLEFIYELKTAALLEAAMMIGAVLAGADDNQVKAAEQIAHHVGMAFQIISMSSVFSVTGRTWRVTARPLYWPSLTSGKLYFFFSMV